MNADINVDRDLKITYVIIACLPVAFSLRYATDGFSMLAILAISFYTTLTLRKPVLRNFVDIQLAAVSLLAGTTLLAWFTGAILTKTLELNEVIFLFVVFAITLFIWLRLRTLNDDGLTLCMSALFDGLAIYVITNVLGYFAGFESPSESVSDPGLSALKWLDQYRIVFPFSNGLSAPPIMAAGYVVAYPFFRPWTFNTRRFVTVMRFLAFVAAIFLIMASGARSPAAACIIVFVTVLLAPRFTMRLLAPLCLVALLLPLWWSMFGSIVVGPLAEVGETVPFFGSRSNRISNRENVESLSDRTKIWNAVLDSAKSSSVPHLLFGYGAEGQIPSGVSRETVYLFQQLRDPTRASTHSTVLQQFIDQGFLGAVLLLIVFAAAASHVAAAYGNEKSGPARRFALASGALLAVFAISGSTDRALGPGLLTDPFWAFIPLALVWSEYHTRGLVITGPVRPNHSRQSIHGAVGRSLVPNNAYTLTSQGKVIR